MNRNQTMTENILYFTSHDVEHGIMKDIIKSQGNDTCRQEINIQYIKDTMNSYDFGFAKITQKSIIGKKHTKRPTDKYHLWGFILCKLNENTGISTIELVCSRQSKTGTGKLLIDKTIEVLQKNKNINIVRILCLPKDRLKTVYKNLGFQEDTILVHEPYMKLYEMTKKII